MPMLSTCTKISAACPFTGDMSPQKEARLGRNGTALLDPTIVRLWLVPWPLRQFPSK